jgi:hypothetical protein
MNFWDFGYVFSTPDLVFGPYSLAYFIVFTLGTIVANFFYFYGKYWFKNNLLTYTLVNRASRNAAIAFSLGFFFFLCRIALLQPFNARIFLDVSVILLVYFIVRGIGYMLRTYPKAKAEWAAQKERRVKKAEPKAAAPIPAAKVTKTVSTAPVTIGAAGDAGSSDGAEDDAQVVKTSTNALRTGLSERGQKRRERKRNKR